MMESAPITQLGATQSFVEQSFSGFIWTYPSTFLLSLFPPLSFFFG